MRTVFRPELRFLMILTALASSACGDDATPADDDTTGSTSGTTDGAVTLATTLTTMPSDETGNPDTTDSGTTEALDDTTTAAHDDTTTDHGTTTGDTTDGESTGTESTGTESTGTESTGGETTGGESTGGELSCDVPEDCPEPVDECLARSCDNQVCGTTPASLGVPCTDGGQVCNAGVCVECIDDAQCSGGSCIDDVCAPVVLGVGPGDQAEDVAIGSSIGLTFSHAMDPATLTAQADTGPCTGSIRVSYDGFASCIGFAAPVLSAGNTVVTVTPDPDYAHGVTYAVRVTTAAESATGVPLVSEWNSTFSTVQPSLCAGTVVISQVYGGGGNLNAQWTHDFVELHNTGTIPVTLDGWSLQYASAASSNWGGNGNTPLHGVIDPGGYYLVQLASGGANGVPLPPPDAVGTTPTAAGSGKFALVSSTTTLSGSCPTGPSIVDFVGYGTADCFEGTGAASTLANSTAAHRDVSGCFDANDNATDFAVGVPTPRNSMSTPGYCSCPLDEVLNESGDDDEADYCVLQHPLSLIVDELTVTEAVFGQIYEAGLTEGGVEPVGILAQLGYGRPAASVDDLNSDWVWFTASYNVHVGNNAEYQASFTAPAVQASTGYAYTYRFSLDDGWTWTYCDSNGAGSNDGLEFEVAELGPMTVNP